MTSAEKTRYDEGTAKIIAAKGGRYTPPPSEDNTDLNNLISWMRANPNTPAPVTTPTPPVTTTDGGEEKINLNRFYLTKGGDLKSHDGNKTKDELKIIYDRYFAQGVLDKETQRITRESDAMRQALIDSINVQYKSKTAKTKQLGEEDLARQRSMNLRSGTIDSPIGDSEIGRTKKNTADELALIAAEKAQAISNALYKFDELKTKKLEAATAAKRQAGQDALTFRQLQLDSNKEAKTEAKSILASMGKAGVDFEKFKLDDAYQTAKDAGLSDLEMLSAINENSPTPTNLTTKIVGSKVITSYYDPITKKTVVTSDDLGFTPDDPDNQQIVTSGGTVMMVDKAKGTAKVLFQGADSDSDLTGTDLKIAYDQAAGATVAQLETEGAFDANGYITPAKYRELKNKWIKSELPGADFDLRMMSYIDPEQATKYPVDKAVSSKFGSTPTFNINTGE